MQFYSGAYMKISVIDAGRRLLTKYDKDTYAITRGYWFPVVLAQKALRDLGVDISFHLDFSDTAFDCDMVLVSSRHHDQIFGTERTPGARARSVAALAQRGASITWVDMRDSSGTTQFEVLPFVKFYLKGCLLKDLSLYQRTLYGGRIFTDYVHRRHGIADAIDVAGSHNQEDDFTLLDPAMADKLRLSWNIGYSFRGLFRSARCQHAWLKQALAGTAIPPAEFSSPYAKRVNSV